MTVKDWRRDIGNIRYVPFVEDGAVFRTIRFVIGSVVNIDPSKVVELGAAVVMRTLEDNIWSVLVS